MLPLLIAALCQSAAVGDAPTHDFERPPLRVCLVSGSFEYESDISLGILKANLEQRYNVACTLLCATGWTELPGLEALDDCDVALFFTRRLRIKGEPLDRVKQYVEAGKPFVAVRTASHGFQEYLEFDKEVMGGDYDGHFGRGPSQKITLRKGLEDHPVLEGFSGMASRHSLYKNHRIASDTEVLLWGKIPDEKVQPVAWTRMYKGGRLFYTSLGGQKDFLNDSFRRLLANALYWAAEREVERAPLPAPPHREAPSGTVKLRLRTREEPVLEREFDVTKTALLICDMWDNHWCSGATERVNALAEKMNPVVAAARDAGIQIIHAPSDTLDHYADTPQRRRAQAAPAVEPPKELELSDPPLPIDDSDGGCTSEETVQYHAWTRQHPGLDIKEPDIISDKGQEVLNYLAQEDIDSILYVGVHTNMCVLGRSFGIRQMSRWGKQCYLVRDLTDTMYDPRDAPNVPHDEGTELVVQHIEEHWCPSLLSADLVAGLPE